jgi:hypothetical protein
MRKRFLIFLSFLFALSALCLSACDSSKKQAIDPKKPAKVQLMKNGQVKTVVLKPVSDLPQHTNFIGTSDQPTMDGGIINAADGLEVNILHADYAFRNRMQNSHVESSLKNSSNKKDLKYASQNSMIEKVEKAENSQPFKDSWATSNKVKTLLKEAAKDGKLDFVLKQSDQKGLPASVATVPMIESRYQENVTSPKGAAGAWQLMPTTAKDYGVNWEDRYKFQPSTEAALNLLTDLHKQFGNWELTFAAYNAGAWRVQTALQKNPQAKSVQELDLPGETKDYVSRIMALNKTMESL